MPVAFFASRVDMLIYLIGGGIRSRQREVYRVADLSRNFVFNALEQVAIGQFVFLQPVRKELYRIALAPPILFFLFGPVVGAIDVADVMTVETVGVAV
jgi:hypothetical protein